MTDRPVCNLRFLAVGMYATGGFTLWHYKSAARLSALLDAGYFDVTDDMLAFGDVLYVRTPDAIAQLAVVEIKDGRVTVAQMGGAAMLPERRPYGCDG
jgi:hypothetical protein